MQTVIDFKKTHTFFSLKLKETVCNSTICYTSEVFDFLMTPVQVTEEINEG